ncbi:LysM domain-containing protein [Thalassobacillus cyri]|uniref:LysM peptidoglycan-binding domain-containing protein n=1 Tax=Thalassobacillus cyri TaxID=571932 RepID=UPI003183F3D4
MSIGDIVTANNIADANVIRVGQQLTIPVKTITYTVKKGDTLYSIARIHNTTVSKIVSANNISNPNFIYPGQQLTIPR